MSDRLVKVRNAYSGAVQDGKPPTVAVANRLKVSRRTAGRLVAAARRHGYLPPLDTPTVVHVKATAVVFRGTVREREWQVCGECLTAWPCDLWRTG